MSAYCTRADIEAMFGVDNVSKWADLDNDADVDKILARITVMIGYASDEIDDRLRDGRYVIPFGTAPTTIKRCAVGIAGTMLYDARGIIEEAEENSIDKHRTLAEKTLNEIVAGKIRLSAALIDTQNEVPRVIKG